ncbi:nucleotide exchange factor GrpE [Convivina intestini]|uniref:Protein GrpE n=1 Tax=Convivina intestini TaxID=1505726 RepID=A0A2U1DFI6_9LACO|nr:nucleotide exchange factor GrpE [Convivina intestini]PVY86437.1 molecular chaperone GrpE [Convivina intestini]CAH1850299.1 Protein GrpE [Convivina intestini]CAH1852261.1 Protein GrpE [Convivina intestini]SDB83677.1 molecular chaperone GrpE [Leuconostocaceae bacterium R-53105]
MAKEDKEQVQTDQELKQDQDNGQTAETKQAEETAQAANQDQVAIEADDQIAQLEKQVGELEDQLLRSQAEVQNIQQRNAREISNIRKYDGQRLATAVVPVVDNLERALAVEDAEDEIALQIKKGVEMTLKTLRQALTDNGITETGKVGEEFDPNTMQGIQSVSADEVDDVEADQVARVLQKGYLLHDRVIRPAMVVVATK